MGPGQSGAEKANGKAEVRIEMGAAVHFVKVGLWQPLLHKVWTMIAGHQLGGRPWADVCREWWEALIAMANIAWK